MYCIDILYLRHGPLEAAVGLRQMQILKIINFHIIFIIIAFNHISMLPEFAIFCHGPVFNGYITLYVEYVAF